MDDPPDPPSESTGEPQPTEIGDRRLPADRRKTARMAVTEGSRRRAAPNASLDDRGDVATLLLGRPARAPGTGLPFQPLDRAVSPMGENVWQPGDRQVYHDLHPTGLIGFGLQPLRSRRGHHASGPKHIARSHGTAGDDDALVVDPLDGTVRQHLDRASFKAVVACRDKALRKGR
jgi:hypothetical protein